MRKLTSFLLVFIFSGILAYSQKPLVSYMIPDIGAPGMNTYVEIIAPYNETNTFGPDRFYDNNESSVVKVRCLNPSDDWKVTFGPVVVSWDGRLITTQAFVHPSLEPDTTDWEALSPEFIIDIVVDRGGNISDPMKFYIVKPFNLGTNGDISGLSYRRLGMDDLGKRSPRGAMIVDSLFFGDMQYELTSNPSDNNSTIPDCDPNTDGNQGYLPFILISKGRMEGSSGTTISVSAESQHAGAGGGGGGGKYCDGNYMSGGSNGDQGGNGFTGGGPGGFNRNTSPFYDDDRNTPGSGTGDASILTDGDGKIAQGGSSLNGVPGGTSTSSYECAGGGTGHPFGTSGEGCSSGTSCDTEGGYGAGSGRRNTQKGGAGGFATDGSPSSSGNSNGGKAHGNVQCVPIAGGSGGASGNPQEALGGCSGHGDGGGGAIRIYAKSMSSLTVTANGGNGQSASAKGGSSSGGMVDLSAKLQLDNISVSAEGGSDGGGEGRIRYDSPILNSVTTAPASPASLYRGISTDTSEWVKKRDTIRGSYQTGRTVSVYMRPENGSWTLIDQADMTYSGNDWEAIIDFPDTDTLYYVVALQDVDNPKEDPVAYTYELEPQYVMSQSAANILLREPVPIIAEDDTTCHFELMGCPGNTQTDTAWVLNIGGADLELIYDKNSFTDGTKGFELLDPIETTVAPGDSIPVIIRYTYQPGQDGMIYDTLIIEHNDEESERIPWRIFCEADVDSLGIEITEDELDFGEMCIGDLDSLEFEVKSWAESSTITLEYEHQDPITNLTVSPQFTELPDGGTGTYKVYFTAEEGLSEAWIYVWIAECPEIIDSIRVSGTGVNAELEFTDTNGKDTVDLGKVCVGSDTTVTIGVRNISIIEVDLNDPSVSDSRFSAQYTGVTTLPVYEVTTLDIIFTPEDEQVYVGKLYIGTDDCGSYRDSIYVKGEGVETELVFNPLEYTFPDTETNQSNTTTVTLQNTGSGNAFIQEPPVLDPPFYVDNYSPTAPTTLKPGDEMTFTIRYQPANAGDHQATLSMSSVDLGSSCPADTSITFYGKGIESEVELSRQDIDFGLIKNCHDTTESVTISNNGTADAQIESHSIDGTDAQYFELASEPTYPYTLTANGGSYTYQVRFVPGDSDDGVKNAQFVINIVGEDKPYTVNLTGENEGLDVDIPALTEIYEGPADANPATELLTVTNNGRFDAHVVEVISSNTKVEVTPQDAIIPANGTYDFTVSMDISEAGPIDAELTFVFDSHCDDTIKANVVGNVLDSDFYQDAYLDFGKLVFCDSLAQGLVIHNIGETSVEVISMVIQGDDADLFNWVEPAPTFPKTYDPDSGDTLQIIFSPKTSEDGVKSAEVVTQVIINDTTKTYRTTLTGERNSGILYVPDPVDFGTQLTGTPITKNVVVTNDDSENSVEILIVNRELFSFEGIYSIDPEPDNILLGPGQSQTFKITFTPKQDITYDDELILNFTVGNCEDQKIITITGRGREAGTIHFEVPVLTEVDPSQSNYAIPVYAWLGDDNDIEDLYIGSVDFNVTFDANMFFPKSASPGSLDRQQVSGTDRVAKVSITGPLMLTKTKKVLTQIYGAVLLADIDSSGITLSDIIILDSSMNDAGAPDIKNGGMSIKICREGGNRYLEPRFPLSIGAYPNPAGDVIRIKINTLESGLHKLELINVQGDVYPIKSWIAGHSGESEFEFTISTDKYSGGMYFIRASAPSENKVIPVFIVK